MAPPIPFHTAPRTFPMALIIALELDCIAESAEVTAEVTPCHTDTALALIFPHAEERAFLTFCQAATVAVCTAFHAPEARLPISPNTLLTPSRMPGPTLPRAPIAVSQPDRNISPTLNNPSFTMSLIPLTRLRTASETALSPFAIPAASWLIMSGIQLSISVSGPSSGTLKCRKARILSATPVTASATH